MFWWQKAASEVVLGRCKQFGFITTNSIHQTFNRRVIEQFLEGRDGSPSGPANGRDGFPSRPANEKRMTKRKKSPEDRSLDDPSSPHPHGPFGKRSLPLHLAYAIPDHPWVDSADGAAVRIAMTVAAPGKADGILEKVISETAREDGENEVSLIRRGGLIAANLQIGADLTSCGALQANSKVVSRGVQTIGEGFVLTPEETIALRSSDLGAGNYIRPYLNGKDLTDKSRGVSVIDFFGLSETEALRVAPACYQRLVITVRPHRLQNSRASYRDNWWILGEPQPALRLQMKDLQRVIVTPVTAKHRFFVFLDAVTLPDQALNTICTDDAFFLGVLSSQLHVVWALAAGGRMGMGNDPRYNNTRCFETFPFPALEEGALKQRIRELGERLDSHRKRQQEQHPGLSLTGIYNVLEKLRSGEALNAKEKQIHDQCLVTVLRQIHDELDEAVLEAYGWGDLSRSVGVSPTVGEEDRGRDAHAPCDALLTRLVALNHERAAEERRGIIRWLRPDYQNPNAAKAPRAEQATLAGTEASSSQSPISNPQSPILWPERLPEQVAIIRKLIGAHDNKVVTPYDAESLSALFGRKNKKRSEQIEGILETLKGLGQL
jgi:hypothetical protein